MVYLAEIFQFTIFSPVSSDIFCRAIGPWPIYSVAISAGNILKQHYSVSDTIPPHYLRKMQDQSNSKLQLALYRHIISR